MNFIATLVTLVLLKYIGSFSLLQRDKWFTSMISRDDGHDGGMWLYAVCLLLPLLLVGSSFYLFSDKFYGLLTLPVAIIVFAYSLGRLPFTVLLQSYRDAWLREDFEHMNVLIKPFEIESNERTISPYQEWVKVREAYLYAAFQGFFAVLFWFVFLGPVGALWYRLNSLYVQNNPFSLAAKIQIGLEWPATFLTGLTFVLVGNVERGIACWKSSIFNRGMSNKNTIHATALAALNMDMHWLLLDQQQPATKNEITQMDAEAALLLELVNHSGIFAVFLMAIFYIVI